LVLLPELWATSFPCADDELAALVGDARDASRRLAEQGERLGVDWAGSGLELAALDNPDAVEQRPANRLELFAQGRRLLAYDKLHLFGPTAEDKVFRAGTRLPATIEWRGHRVSGVVCYDLRFPELLRTPFLAGAELMLVPAQWPVERASQWRALVCGLAVSGQCFVLACNRLGSERVARRGLTLEFPGNSLIVAPSGEVLAEGRGQPGLVAAAIDPAMAGEWRRPGNARAGVTIRSSCPLCPSRR
jgi:predicted amidohydrolase